MLEELELDLCLMAGKVVWVLLWAWLPSAAAPATIKKTTMTSNSSTATTTGRATTMASSLASAMASAAAAARSLGAAVAAAAHDDAILCSDSDFWGAFCLVLLYAMSHYRSATGHFRVLPWVFGIWLVGSGFLWMLCQSLEHEVR